MGFLPLWFIIAPLCVIGIVDATAWYMAYTMRYGAAIASKVFEHLCVIAPVRSLTDVVMSNSRRGAKVQRSEASLKLWKWQKMQLYLIRNVFSG